MSAKTYSILEDRFKTLPKWAQTEITHLRWKVEQLQKDVATCSQYEVNDKPGIKFQVGADVKNFDRWYTVPDRNVRVFLPNGAWVDVRPDHDASHGHHVHVMTDHGVVVQPTSSNTFRIIPEGRHGWGL
jgi:hypothetical protein